MHAKPSVNILDRAAHEDLRTGGNAGGRGHVAAVDNGGNLDPQPAEIARGAPAVIVVGEDRDRFPGGGPPAVGIGPHRAGQHHAGPVVIAEGDRTFGRPGTQQGALRIDPPQDLTRLVRRAVAVVGALLQGTVYAVIVGAVDTGPGHQADIVHRPQLARRPRGPVGAGHAVDLEAFRVETAAGQEILIRQDHARAAARGGQRRLQARRARPDDQQVAMQEALVIAVRIVPPRQPAQTGGRPDRRFVDLFPEALRPHEGLVVEPGAEERRDQVVHLQQIELQRPAMVLARGLQTVEQFRHRRPRVGLAPGAGADFDIRAFGSSGPAVKTPRGR